MAHDTRKERLRLARQRAGFPTAAAASEAFGWKSGTYASNENGNAPFSYNRGKEYAAAFGVTFEWLYEGLETSKPVAPRYEVDTGRLVPVIGRVGADPEGRVLFAAGQGGGDLAPLPPGGSGTAVALQVVGHSMGGIADDGGLIYFEHQRTPPTEDMFGQVVVVETDTDEVLVKRLRRGRVRGRYDLESVVGPTRHDCKLRWAAHITAIIPPHQARKILRTHSA